MAHILLLVPLLWLSSQISPGVAEPECHPIPICAGFQTERVGEDDDQPMIAGFKNESDIGRQRHWEGVVPEKYRIQLNFVNTTDYKGSVDITFKLIQPTDRIMINHHIRNPIVDYNLITIRPKCGGTQSLQQAPPTTRCIQKATFLAAQRTLILDLKQANLKVNSTYIIAFPSFRGRSQDSMGNTGATGLREASGPEDGPWGNYSAVTTIFQMRYARTVFPCFDHPALKAKFELCVEHPADITVASNTLRVASLSSTVGPNLKRDCFEPTPVIPSYVFTFALMENYSSESIQAPGGPEIVVYAPAGGISGLRWMLNESVPVVQYMEKTTKFKYPLKRLAFVAQYPAPFWGVENFGLVTVDGTHMQGKGPLAYTILYHEIVHQWLGNVATIEDWNEICLQEGLTAYFEWKISAERRNGDLDRKAEYERVSNDGGYYDPYALKDYAVTQDIADHCFGRPPFFFHTIAKSESFATIENFLAKLIEKRKFGVGNLELWDQIMDEVSTAKDHAMKGYVKGRTRRLLLTHSYHEFLSGWFLQPGPLYLTSSKVQGTDCIQIQQKMYVRDDDSPAPSVSRPVPINVNTYGASPKTISKVLTSLENRVCGVGDAIFLVDPKMYTFTRKAYTADNYRRMLQLQKQTPTTLTVEELNNFVGGFCKAMRDDVLPLENDRATRSDWSEVYQLIRNSSVALGETCRICLNTKEENQAGRRFQWMWDRWCRDLRLNRFLGRNYTFIEQKTGAF